VKNWDQMGRHCLIATVGHHPDRLIFSIDKEIVEKIIFITEREELPGSEKARETLDYLTDYFTKKTIEVENIKLHFKESTMLVAELIFLIYQQRALGFKKISLNISAGLRYIDIWFYISCCLTNMRIIHGEYKYEGDKEIGIYYNIDFQKIPIKIPTEKQFEILELFFMDCKTIKKILYNQEPFEKLLGIVVNYKSIEELRKEYERRIKKEISRGALYGYFYRLKENSAIRLYSNPENKVETSVEITYLGIAYVLYFLFNKT